MAELRRRARASLVCVHEGRLLCVWMRDPATRVARLFLPGGGLEPGESPAAAAEREVVEETGYRARVEPESELVSHYDYEWNAQRVAITTHFFTACLLEPERGPATVRDADYNEGVHWLPLAEVHEALGFHAEILRAVEALLARPRV